MDNQQERVEARKALEAALKGKWEATGEGWFNNPDCAKIVVKDDWGQTYVAQTYAGNHQVANAHLIANCPTWLCNSLDREEQLIVENEQFTELLTLHQMNGVNLACKVAEQDKEIINLKAELHRQGKHILGLNFELDAYREEEIRPRFKMDANGNLTRIDES